MKKVYLVVVDSVTDYHNDFSVVAFKNYKDAKVNFDMEVRAAKDDRDEDWIEDVSIDMYSTYDDGYYSKDHIDVSLLERAVQGE